MELDATPGETGLGPTGWFANQLRTTAEGLVWGVRQMPSERLYASPPAPDKLGEWSAARHLFHVCYYERGVALPYLRYWLGGPYPTAEGYDEARDWGDGSGHDIEELLAQLQALRVEQISLLPPDDSPIWHEARDTVWGHWTLYRVISKSYQHSVQHMSDIQKIAMLWEHYAGRSQKSEIRSQKSANLSS